MDIFDFKNFFIFLRNKDSSFDAYCDLMENTVTKPIKEAYEKKFGWLFRLLRSSIKGEMLAQEMNDHLFFKKAVNNNISLCFDINTKIFDNFVFSNSENFFFSQELYFFFKNNSNNEAYLFFLKNCKKIKNFLQFLHDFKKHKNFNKLAIFYKKIVGEVLNTSL